ncbi:amino acid ABC transporter permease [Flexibacterium corallicola]|uniref:amino acid ABC transporter permease n=1 Tax=Flexibacterium corallicola TaxID=3037259 RepID=UPI00286F0CDF|nr:amino acid ABC transporter permease [Pseudovibrio sp. M1P-2-3]
MLRFRKKPRRDYPFWLMAFFLGVLIFAWLIAVDGAYLQIARNLMKGVGITLFVAITSFVFAGVLGLVIGVLRTKGNRFLRELASFYTEIIRGLPILVVLFYVAFVGAPHLTAFYNWLFSWAIDAGLLEKMRVRDFSMTWRAIVALSVCYSAFIAEVFRAGIESVPKGQIEAASALGLSRWQTFRFIIWPQALKTVMPPLGNDFISMIKDSALVSVLGVQDITQLGKIYSSSTFMFFETYNVVAYMYLVMTVSLSLIVKALEHRLKKNESV